MRSPLQTPEKVGKKVPHGLRSPQTPMKIAPSSPVTPKSAVQSKLTSFLNSKPSPMKVKQMGKSALKTPSPMKTSNQDTSPVKTPSPMKTMKKGTSPSSTASSAMKKQTSSSKKPTPMKTSSMKVMKKEKKKRLSKAVRFARFQSALDGIYVDWEDLKSYNASFRLPPPTTWRKQPGGEFV